MDLPIVFVSTVDKRRRTQNWPELEEDLPWITYYRFHFPIPVQERPDQPRKHFNWKTPYEMLHLLLNEREIEYEERLRLPSQKQHQPDISNLFVFGARA